MSKIKKLELKHLCGYLPYDLVVETNRGTRYYLGVLSNMRGSGIETREISTVLEMQYKSLLLPLSALTEPLEDGNVPIVELAKMAKFWNNKNQNYFVNTERFTYGCSGQEYDFWFCSDGSFNATRLLYEDNEFVSESACIINNQVQLFEYLYSKHFDIYGLIDAGLAIDKRTVKL